MSNCFFSIIVPVYNVSLYLRECLDSLVNQDFQNFEIILVNDGSTDSSEEICMEFQQKYRFIKYYYKQNGGLSSARNYGIEKSEGKYLLFVDSDDILINNNFLSLIYQRINNTDVDLFMYLPLEFKENGTEIFKRHNVQYFKLDKIVNGKDIIDDLYSLNAPYTTLAQTKIIKKEFLTNRNLYFIEGIYHEDDEWIARTLLSYPNVFISDIEGYGYRHRENSIVSSRDIDKVFKKCCDRLRVANQVVNIQNIIEHKKCLTYFLSYYITTFTIIVNYPDNLEKFINFANGLRVVDAMRNSLLRKHRLMYLYKKVFGIKATNRLIFKLIVKKVAVK